MSAYPRAFVLRRLVDNSGISGTGDVAEGVEFGDGTVALRWTSSATPTSVVFHDQGVESVRRVHGHGGDTIIVWAGEDTGEQPGPPPVIDNWTPELDRPAFGTEQRRKGAPKVHDMREAQFWIGVLWHWACQDAEALIHTRELARRRRWWRR